MAKINTLFWLVQNKKRSYFNFLCVWFVFSIASSLFLIFHDPEHLYTDHILWLWLRQKQYRPKIGTLFSCPNKNIHEYLNPLCALICFLVIMWWGISIHFAKAARETSQLGLDCSAAWGCFVCAFRSTRSTNLSSLIQRTRHSVQPPRLTTHKETLRLESALTHILVQLLNLGVDLGVARSAGWETVEQDVISVILRVLGVKVMVVPLCATWKWRRRTRQWLWLSLLSKYHKHNHAYLCVVQLFKLDLTTKFT